MNGKEEALKTYVDQTKLLVTLASGFVLAPAAAVSLVRSSDSQVQLHVSVPLFLIAEGCLIVSVILGYMVLGSIAGSQYSGDFNVYRPATRILSLFQLVFYLGGLCCFVFLIRGAVSPSH